MTVLRRKLGKAPTDTAPVPLTASRAMRLALSRAAQEAARLPLTVGSVSVESGGVDDLLGVLSDDMMLVHLRARGELAGVCAMDASLVQALGEVRTTGRLQTAAVDDRPMTQTDRRLADPMVMHLLSELAGTTEGTALDGWVTGVGLGDAAVSVRALGLDLADVSYRVMTATLDLGLDDRQAEITLALPAPDAPHARDTRAPAVPTADWDVQLRATVMPASACLTAVVHRMTMPLSRLQAMAPGDTIKLAGCTTGTVRLETVKGQLFGKGRLGQIAGNVAVRLETDAGPVMADMPRKDASPQLAPSDTS